MSDIKKIYNKENKPYILKYSYPADNSYKGWEEESLPLGNGSIGAKIFGGIEKERIQINEKSLWSGGPDSDDYDFNNSVYKDRYKYVEKIRKLLDKGLIEEAREIAENKLVGPETKEYGRYLNFGDLYIKFLNHSEDIKVLEYKRELDIKNSIHKITYTYDDTRYIRESFVSYPDNILVSNITREGNKNIDIEIDLDINNDIIVNGEWKSDSNIQFKKINKKVVNKDSILILGEVIDNNLKFSSYLLIDTDGIKKVKDNNINILDASFVTIYLSLKTDYALDHKTNYRNKNIDLEGYVIKNSLFCKNKSYINIKNDHINDYKNLFDRVKFNISKYDNRDTNILLKEYKKESDKEENKEKNEKDDNKYLEELFFQYGRYLLISSSREGKDMLPANLQGIWNGCDNPPWNSDYHLNINLEMNYWPSFVTNLMETSIPLINFIDDIRFNGRIVAKEYGGIKSSFGEENGWMIHTQVTPFGWTNPGWNYYWGWAPSSNAWIMQNIFDYYRFSLDKEYLRDKIYPMLKETVKFWNSFLYYDNKSDRYCSSPSYSPEHGDISIGNTYDQSLICELFDMFIEASDVLGYEDYLLNEVKIKKEKLKPLSINKKGMIKEWYEEDEENFVDLSEKEHRHVSHLVGLYPGTLFDFSDMKLIEASKNTLNDRKDGGTGWSKANKINLWARLLDGNRSYKLLNELIKKSTLNNLLDSHPPFQIDGNLGAVSGIAEMLVQSHLEKIKLLPALPDNWNSGSFSGLRARGNFEISVIWDNFYIKDIEIKSNSGGILNLEYINISMFNIEKNKGKIEYEVVNNDSIKIDTKIGDVIKIWI